MSKSKSKLIGAVSSPVKIMPNLAPPPSFPVAISTPMLQAMLDRRTLSNQERSVLGDRNNNSIMYVKNVPNWHNRRMFYLFLEQIDSLGRIQFKLIPYQGSNDQILHNNVIRAYQNLGYNVSNTISSEMSWRFGAFNNDISNGTQFARLIINGASPFTSRFVFSEIFYSANPPYPASLKEARFERAQTLSEGDLGIDYQRMMPPIKISRTSSAGDIQVTREESKSITPGNLLIVGGLLFAGIYAYDKLKKK